MDWRLADAKNRLSELVNRALTEGPQRVLRHKDVVVVMSETEFEKLTSHNLSFKDFLTQGPSFDDLDLRRDKSPMRDVTL